MRTGRQLHRHRRRLHPGRVGGHGGRTAPGQRHDWVLATKLGNAMSKRPNEGHYSRSWMLREVEASLRACRPTTSTSCTCTATTTAWTWKSRCAPGRAAARRQDPLLGRVQLPRLAHRRDGAPGARLGMPGPVVCQPYYNLLNRMPEVEILPACAHHGIGVVPYSPVARGVLTGKYAAGPSPAPRAPAPAAATSASPRPSSARSRWPSPRRCRRMPRPRA
jgi:hypothetical protein